MRAAVASFVVAAVALASSGRARAQDARLAVVDASGESRNERLVAEVEREVVRLRPGTRAIEDAAMKRLLATGEGPAAAAVRLGREAQRAVTAGDCATAVIRAKEAEGLTLASVSLDDERDLLRSIYVALVTCEHERGRTAERDTAARRLRDLVSLPPPGLPQELWDKHVAGATAGPATTELAIDSEPANAQVSVNLHGEGVTPRTLKVPQGTAYVEVQKEGYLKAFRKLEVGAAPARAVFRLVERTHDRLDQALETLNLLRKSDLPQRTQTLSRLAQLVRADTLVVLQVADERVKLWFFDAEGGGLSKDTLQSSFDPRTGRVAALADRPTPAARAAGSPPAAPRPGTAVPAAPQPAAAPPGVAKRAEGLPEAQAQQQAALTRRRRRPAAPWWSWVIAGLLGAALGAYIFLDQPQRRDTLAVRAFWSPPSAGQ